MTRGEREALSQRICNFYIDSSNNSVKTTVNYFKKQNIPQTTIYNILRKYRQHGTTKYLPKSGRPYKISDKQLDGLVKSVNNRCGLSQRKLGRRFGVHHSTISRTLRKRTSVVIRKRRKAPKMNSEDQESRARKNCGKMYRKLLRGCDYHHNGNYLFWPDLASAHYSNLVKERLHKKNVPFVARQDNPPNVPQARPIETVWALLERKVYENNWEAKNLDALARRIKQKAKELDQKMLQAMVEGVRKKLRTMWRDELYSVC
ncbi:unnamed protein product [Rotaria magnacalcarata]|uniref:Uncharacterized protein n=1 Tax=Rotaria magnacalcarata TaxID=392030 RepID=A0A816QWT8_9BILA|nr:unnamed protein product [Rotaria magnacalcarata]CAF2078285.1 unnamed protein product [Rotaria magnacalcarata]CAF3901445.1 unnamed protein product [Rotaria magnacalcarata]CAF4115315.1 unnamed protein product [Rotaria magnacalcarata]